MSQPNKTLYIKNLNDKVRKDELKAQLYALLTPYGRIIDVVATKRANMRGQAFVVFHDLAGATAAMRAWDGELFYDKEMRIEYAKTRSHATRKVEEPGWDPLTEAKVKALGLGSRLGANGAAVKRERDDDAIGHAAKRGRGEDMETDDTQAAPSSRLLCTNLPPETTQEALQALFQHYPGFYSVAITSTGPSTSAQVLYENVGQATAVKDALAGYAPREGWPMTVVFA